VTPLSLDIWTWRPWHCFMSQEAQLWPSIKKRERSSLSVLSFPNLLCSFRHPHSQPHTPLPCIPFHFVLSETPPCFRKAKNNGKALQCASLIRIAEAGESYRQKGKPSLSLLLKDACLHVLAHSHPPLRFSPSLESCYPFGSVTTCWQVWENLLVTRTSQTPELGS
jgi:hypothetical protein